MVKKINKLSILLLVMFMCIGCDCYSRSQYHITKKVTSIDYTDDLYKSDLDLIEDIISIGLSRYDLFVGNSTSSDTGSVYIAAINSNKVSSGSAWVDIHNIRNLLVVDSTIATTGVCPKTYRAFNKYFKTEIKNKFGDRGEIITDYNDMIYF